MVTLEDLYAAYIETRRNKRRSDDSVAYEINLERNLMGLLSGIENHTLRPTAYTFVTMKPKPREIFACEMGLRVIHHYIDLRLRPIIESKLTDRTYNNRKGMGQCAAINQVISDIYEVSAGFTRDAYIIKLDLSGYFPNASQDIVYSQLERLILDCYDGPDKDELIYMLQVSVFSYPTDHCWRKSPLWKWQEIPREKSLFSKPCGIGAAIGHLIWQNAMNYYLNDLDHYITDTLGIRYVRFVDDMIFVVQDKEAFLPLIHDIRAKLAEYGCRLNERKFYCQHWSKGLEFLGSYIKVDRLYPGKRVVRSAYNSLGKLPPRPRNVQRFVSSINSYLGILKTRNGYNVTSRLLRKVNPKWWNYLYFDKERITIRPIEKYSHFEMLNYKYHLKNDKRTTRIQTA